MYRIVAVLTALGIAIAGCAGIGDESTTCKDFNAMGKDTQSATVARVLKAHNGLNSSTSDVLARVASTVAFCATNGNQSKTVNDVK